GGDPPSTSMPSGSVPVTPEEMAARNRQLEQQRSNLQEASYGQRTESARYRHGSQQVENADDLDLDGVDVPEEKVVEIARSVKTRKDMKGVKKPRLEQPLIEAARGGKYEKVLYPANLPADAEEIGEDVSVRFSYVKGHIRTHVIRRKKYKDPAGNYYHVNLPEEYGNCMGRTQVTESLVAQILTMHFHYHMTIGDIEGWLRGMGLNFSHSTIIHWIEIGADILAPLDEPLHKEITSSGEVHGDESTLKCKDRRLAGKDESEDDVGDDLHYFKRWIFCYYAPLPGLTQFVFHGRGRRTQEAVRNYFEDVMEKLYLHSDGAPIYKCYDVGELIVRIACLVHMRRPFHKLRDVSTDAMMILKIIESIFKADRQIKATYGNPQEITRERVLRIAPLFNDLKSYLDKLQSGLDPKEEPELLKAVNYALKEYPCMIRCLEEGGLDLSNNICERQIRRVAKYRNNSFFVGSPEAGVRFARLMSVFANIRTHKLDPVEYLCDVFRRIKKTATEKFVDLLAHRWQPASVAVWDR
ncbi:MAG: IS66 family transposase, partial [Prevotella sp.]